MPKVSIIVPIYNVEKYLYKCVSSIINQTLEDIEVILVDDGSTDNSSKIADYFGNCDKRVKVIHKSNGGQGSARNEGLKAARGKYIGFVDADDYIDREMYERLYIETSKGNFDIGVSSRKIVSEAGEIIYELNIGNEEVEVTNLSEYMVSKLLYKHTVSSCNKIYRADLIKENKIKFLDVDKVGSEDALFNYKCLLNVKKIKEVGDVFYFGVDRGGSTTREFKEDSMVRTSNLLDKIYEYSSEVNREEDGRINAIIFNIFFQQYNYNNIKKFNEKDKLSEILKNEISLGYKNNGLRVSSKEFLLTNKADKYLKRLGYGNSGLIFIRLFNFLCLIGMAKTAARVRVVRG